MTENRSRGRDCDWRIRWDAARAAAAYADGWWVRETLGHALARAASTDPQRVLLVDGESRVDAQTLYHQASSLARAMLRRFPAGSVVSFMLPNWREAATIYMGATLAGMVANPVLPSLRDRELLFILKDVRSRMIFAPEEFRNYDYSGMMSRVAAKLDPRPEVVIVRGESGAHAPYDSLLDQKVDQAFPRVDPDAVRMVLYTSGTTGTPKGVLHSHNSIHALVRQLGLYWLAEPGDAFLVPSPISHIGGSIYAFECPLLLGAKAVLMDRWDAGEAVRLAAAERCTHMAGATPFLRQFLDAAKGAGAGLDDLKLFVCGGASVPPTLIRDAAAYFDNAIVTRVYGSTEVPVVTVGSLGPSDVAYAAETDGRAGVAEIKLLDSSGRPAQEGEIWARAPQMLVGYLHEQDESSVFDDEGFYRTGDIGRWVDDGFLVISGRAKDIIIRNGENISPKEIEDLLIDHPNIADVAIIGLPDERTGERACAAIVPKTPPAPTVSDVRDFLKALGAASFKIPEEIASMSALPKNDAGKVLKHEIRAALLGAKPTN